MPKTKSKINRTAATVLTPEEYDRTKRRIPEAWRKAAGILKSTFTEDPVVWQRRIRRESDEHRDELIRQALGSDDR